MLQPAFAQCTDLDEYEPNNWCTIAAPIHTHLSSNLTLSHTNLDFYSITVPAGATCDIGVYFSHSEIDINVNVFASCSVTASPFVTGVSSTDNEFVSWTNSDTIAWTYYIRVYTSQTGACGTYGLLAVMPICPLEDRFEPASDSCSSTTNPPPLLSEGTYNALVCKPQDNDYYRVLVPAGATTSVVAWFRHDIASNGNLGLELSSGCLTPTIASSSTFTDNESLRWTNSSGVDRMYFVRVRHNGIVPANSCADYSLTIDTDCTVDDTDEDNDTCATALASVPGVLQDRIVRLGDEDWYEVLVPNSATLRATSLFDSDDADIDMELRVDCSGSPVDLSASLGDSEVVAWTNTTGAAALARINCRVWSGTTSGFCASYDLTIALEGGALENVVPSCFGDGSGTPCPCNNDSATGHLGGCAHQDGPGAILAASGSPSVSAGGGPHFQLTSGPADTFAILVSGDNALPQVGPCIGCGLTAFDGLRCAGGDFLRHGSRAINSSGNSNSGWGFPSNPMIGIAQASGFIDGQTRHFQAFFRTALDQTCGTGQNATNSLSVTFGP